MKFYTEEGNWDLVGNDTPVFFLRDPLKFPDLNHAMKRGTRTQADLSEARRMVRELKSRGGLCRYMRGNRRNRGDWI